MVGETEQSRLRFEDFSLEVFPDGHCRAEVTLERSGRRFSGVAEGTDTPEGKLRAAATACLKAAQGAADRDLTLELRGVKAVRAFDAWVVIVSVKGDGKSDRYRLLGAATSPDDEGVPRSGATAVLDATNRVLAKHL